LLARPGEQGTGAELWMPLGQRIAHVRPEGRIGIRDLIGELLVGSGDGLPEVEAGDIRAQPPQPRPFVSYSGPQRQHSATSPIGVPLAQLFQGTSECLATGKHGLEQVTALFDPLERLGHPEPTRRHVLR
jgi:hypothetical protein